MINNNASSIFQGKAMGVEERDADNPDESFEESYSKDNLINILNPVGFENKVMGGQRSSMFLDGKMPRIGGAQEYSERLTFLTNQPGGFKMTENIGNNELKGFFGNSDNPFKKISAMTKNNNSNNNNM